MQVGPPGAGGFDPGSLFSYNSQAAAAGAGSYGSGWTATYNRYIRQLSTTVALVVDGVGNVFMYTRPNAATTRYTPPAGANNGLVAASGGWIETQPDGLSYIYPAPGSNQVAMLQAVQNRNGGLWTMTYDATGTQLGRSPTRRRGGPASPMTPAAGSSPTRTWGGGSPRSSSTPPATWCR